MNNFFKPLFEVTIDPESDPVLFHYLLSVVGFDSVDDESIVEQDIDLTTLPIDWDHDESPSYHYWIYYMWANLQQLNVLRKQRDLNTFTLRPHSGESGSPGHLMSTFLLCDAINHGINLNEEPVLMYLYYLEQLPVSVSPLSNN